MKDECISIDEAKRLASGPLGRQLADVVAAYAAPIFGIKSHSPDGTHVETSNGTTFFLDLGKTICGVTAGHVYDGLTQLPGASAGCRIGKSSAAFDLEARKISRGRTVDIFTFDVSRAEAESTMVRVLVPSRWPPAAPEVDHSLIFAGFPGHETRVNHPLSIEFGFFSGAGVIESVRERDFSCQVDREGMVPFPGLALPEPGYDFAGISGAPVLRVLHDHVLRWELIGIIYECGRNFVELIKMARADLICSDGRVAG